MAYRGPSFCLDRRAIYRLDRKMNSASLSIPWRYCIGEMRFLSRVTALSIQYDWLGVLGSIYLRWFRMTYMTVTYNGLQRATHLHHINALQSSSIVSSVRFWEPSYLPNISIEQMAQLSPSNTVTWPNSDQTKFLRCLTCRAVRHYKPINDSQRSVLNLTCAR